MKKVTAALLGMMLSAPVLSYEIGDTVSPEVSKMLKIDPNKAVVVDFFASWCKSCEKEIPDLQKFINEEKTKKVQLVGVDVDEELADGLKFQKKLDIKFPVVNDTKQKIIEAFAPIGMPAMYYIVDGKIAGKHIGPINNIEQTITADLKKAGVSIK